METLYLLLATVVLNEISVNFSSLFLVQEKNVSKTFASFGENFEQLSMNIRTEAEKFELRPTFENTINEIKDNHLKSIAPAAMNLSAITLTDKNLEQLSMNRIIEAAKFKPEPTFENTINEIKANHLKSLYSLDMNISTITYNEPYSSSEHLKSDIMP